MLRSAKDADLWLTKRLEKPWSSEKLSSSLTQEILKFSVECFPSLDSNTKLNLLLSFLCLRRPAVQKMKEELESIIKLGEGDTDTWVQIISKMIAPAIIDDAPICNHEKFLQTCNTLKLAGM